MWENLRKITISKRKRKLLPNGNKVEEQVVMI